MAKNFPYFKFIAYEWLTGDIVFEDMAVQGLFINICALYWQRDGRLSIDEINKRYKEPKELKELVGRFLHEKNGNISISFLDEQFSSTKLTSKTNSDNGSKGGRPLKYTGEIRLYLLHCFLNEENFYKIGITNDTISRRYSNTTGGTKKIPYKFSISFEAVLDFHLALKIEQAVSDKFQRFIPSLKFAGYNECVVFSDKVIPYIESIINKEAKTDGFFGDNHNESEKKQIRIREEKNKKETREDNIELHPLQIFIKEKYPNVSKLKTQLTYQNAEELVKNYDKTLLKLKLDAMENKADLAKKYSSVYLTLNNWCKENNSNSSAPAKPTQHKVLASKDEK